MRENDQGSSPTEIAAAVRARVAEWGIPHKFLEIDPDFADTARFCAKYGYSPVESVNCIVVATKTGPRRYAACLVQAVRRLDVNRTVRRLLEARKVSFASAEETVALTGMIPGGVTPVALPDGVPVYVDAPIMDLEEIILGGGDRSSKLFVAPGPLVAHLPDARVVEGLSLPADGS